MSVTRPADQCAEIFDSNLYVSSIKLNPHILKPVLLKPLLCFVVSRSKTAEH